MSLQLPRVSSWLPGGIREVKSSTWQQLGTVDQGSSKHLESQKRNPELAGEGCGKPART